MRRISIWKLILALFCAQLPLVAVLAADGEEQMMTCQLPPEIITLPTDGVSNDSLFKCYVERRIEASLPGHEHSAAKGGTRSGAEMLTGNNARLFNALVPRIQAIARGEVSSTVITIPVAEVVDCSSYTAEQLGVSSIMSGSGLSTAAYDKYKELVMVDNMKIIYALLSDLPYDLYWFDKTVSSSWSLPASSYNSTAFSITGSYKVPLYVAKGYSATNAEKTTTLGTEKLSKVETAIATAQQVVSSASGTPKEKMQNYFQWICDNVSYNNEAAEDENIPYGDPWQMIWAFDNDPDTKIVCEGYSKAFKYLCDLSGFDDVECLLVSGDLGSVQGGIQGPPGAHMWNVVRMDDGRNYLVDVTNGDGALGEALFLYYNPYSAYGDEYGSYESGYILIYDPSSGSYISFNYDDDTRKTFGEQALTLSSLPYETPASKVNLSETENVASQLSSFAGKSGVHVNFRRTNLTAEKPATVCLPFDFTLPQINIGQFYTLSGVTVNETTGKWEAKMTKFTGSTLSANTPYVFIPTFGTVDFSGDYDIPASISAGATTVGKWSLIGTYAVKSWTAEGKDYGFTATNGRSVDGFPLAAGTFVKCAAGASIAPLRCYLSYNGVAGTRGMDEILPETISVRFVNGQGDTTNLMELNTVTGEWTSDEWYDLNGRRLNGEPTVGGIYIHNGKKVRK